MINQLEVWHPKDLTIPNPQTDRVEVCQVAQLQPLSIQQAGRRIIQRLDIDWGGILAHKEMI